MREEEKSMQDFQALYSSLISSDESDENQDTLVTRPLVWRAEEVSTIFQGLDLGHKERLSNKAEDTVCKDEGWSSQQQKT